MLLLVSYCWISPRKHNKKKKICYCYNLYKMFIEQRNQQFLYKRKLSLYSLQEIIYQEIRSTIPQNIIPIHLAIAHTLLKKYYALILEQVLPDAAAVGIGIDFQAIVRRRLPITRRYIFCTIECFVRIDRDVFQSRHLGHQDLVR